MNDEQLGRLSRALLNDLDQLRNDDGRLVATARVLAHVRECGRIEATLASEDAVPWMDPRERTRTLREQPNASAQRSSPPLRPPAPSMESLVERASASHAMARRLLDNAPGPITRYARALALAAAPAQLAIQWGERVEFAKVMDWVANACLSLRLVTPLGLDESESVFAKIGALATLGAVTDPDTEHYDPEMLIGFGRRTIADLGSISRAAAAAEGRAECDQIFWLDDGVMTSVRGIAPHEARLCVSQIATHLNVVGHPPREEDLAKHREHIAALNSRPAAPRPIDLNGDGLAARSYRSELAQAQSMAASARGKSVRTRQPRRPQS